MIKFMKYLGSKARIAKIIVHHVTRLRKPGQWYVEPFCGGCNVIDKISNPRLANDRHPYLIAMFQAIQDGWIPPDKISEGEYDWVRMNVDQYPPHYVGFVGFCCSFSGGWWNGYARGEGRNHLAESQRYLLKQDLHGIEFRCGDYRSLDMPPDSFIYCDPPYKGTKKYNHRFDHLAFYRWCVQMKDAGHTLLISELDMPANFSMLHQISLNHGYAHAQGTHYKMEKLWTL